LTLRERFEQYVDRLTPHGPEGKCHRWTSSLSSKGYGQFWANGSSRSAHVVAFEFAHGPVPAGREVGHSCDTHDCVNDEHLLPVTHAENMAEMSDRQQFCKHGHEYTPENTHITPRGHKRCRTCARESDKRRQPRRRSCV